MGFFGLFKPATPKRKSAPRASAAPAAVVVHVAFCDLDKEPRSGPGGWYLYRWPLPGTPRVGDRVRVPSDMGSGFAMVMRVGASRAEIDDAGRLKSVTRVVPQAEVDAAIAKVEADLNAWLEMGRRAVGLPTKTRRQNPPGKYPPIPPTTGDATPDVADEHARVWAQLAKAARDDEERKAFDAAKFRWRAVRKRGQ